jgi:hypothetical protein
MVGPPPPPPDCRIVNVPRTYKQGCEIICSTLNKVLQKEHNMLTSVLFRLLIQKENVANV